jgi:hypothetical protein
MTRDTIFYKGYWLPLDTFAAICAYLETDEIEQKDLNAFRCGLLSVYTDEDDEQEVVALESFSRDGEAALNEATTEIPYEALLSLCTEVTYSIQDEDYTGFVFDYRNWKET